MPPRHRQQHWSFLAHLKQTAAVLDSPIVDTVTNAAAAPHPHPKSPHTRLRLHGVCVWGDDAQGAEEDAGEAAGTSECTHDDARVSGEDRAIFEDDCEDDACATAIGRAEADAMRGRARTHTAADLRSTRRAGAGRRCTRMRRRRAARAVGRAGRICTTSEDVTRGAQDASVLDVTRESVREWADANVSEDAAVPDEDETGMERGGGHGWKTTQAWLGWGRGRGMDMRRSPGRALGGTNPMGRDCRGRVRVRAWVRGGREAQALVEVVMRCGRAGRTGAWDGIVRFKLETCTLEHDEICGVRGVRTMFRTAVQGSNRRVYADSYVCWRMSTSRGRARERWRPRAIERRVGGAAIGARVPIVFMGMAGARWERVLSGVLLQAAR
ncbi:hypothetical protein B0H17DRAFT_1134392 [Mycena rosella]|uniref:Uncharacterized protein n=1 Tax=Mycena rosella TaxID=1033263 RepID=A0AAD7GGY1_MYCRO|nr:hypothetical protein B0H17DRAFT_1134392 [Mycena rosella]